jgi:hypothetical protein
MLIDNQPQLLLDKLGSIGLMQVVTDPRITQAHLLHGELVGEMTGLAGICGSCRLKNKAILGWSLISNELWMRSGPLATSTNLV